VNTTSRVVLGGVCQGRAPVRMGNACEASVVVYVYLNNAQSSPFAVTAGVTVLPNPCNLEGSPTFERNGHGIVIPDAWLRAA